ncbi:molybdopterin-dependent oxidoreductase [Chloroflexota bacterium]
MEGTSYPGNTSGGTEKVVMTTCNSHCGGQCLLKVYVKDGVITRIETDDGAEPQYRACLKGRAQRQRVYAPDRLKYPMKRVGARGEGKFERISWDEALDIMAGELKRVRDTYGPGAIILRAGAGDITYLHSQRAIRRLLGITGGYSQHWGTFSHQGGRYASVATVGTLFTQNSRDDILNSRLIILWGVDPANTVQHTNTCWYLAQARELGIRIISIDPRYTDTTAVFANQWIPIRPGTDAAMLIAMAYVMLKENLQDQNFLDTYTIGFEQFERYVLGEDDGVPKTPAWAEAITGVPTATIENLAREYATTRPAALVAGVAAGRTAYGEQYHRAAHTLAAMTGNVGKHGGDSAGKSWAAFMIFSFMKLGGMNYFNPVEDDAPQYRYSIVDAEVRDRGRINMAQIADAVLKGKEGGYPFDYKLLYIVNANYLNQAPDANKCVRAFNKLEFIIVHEQFMTATAKFADILLPESTFLERNDICIGGAVPFYGCMNKVIEPLYESKSVLEVADELAARMGITGFNDKTEDEWMRHMVQESLIPDYDDFKQKGIYTPEISKQYVALKKEIEDPTNNPFPTPSGKIEIYSQRLTDMDNPEIPPVPKYIETWESINDPLADKYPLQLITTHTKRRAHSQFETSPWLRELLTQTIRINTADAQVRGIADGDEVRVFNDRGEMVISARLTERIMPGVVDIPQGAWYTPDEKGVDRGGCANVLTSDKVSPGGAVPFNTCLVQVQKA